MTNAAEPKPTPILPLVSMAGAGMLLGAMIAIRALGAGALPEELARVPWYVSRAAGITAYLLLSAGTVLGLVMSTRLLGRRVSGATVFVLHEHLSWLALAFVALHAGALLFDTYAPFSLPALVIPLVSSYKPVAVALGVLAFYLMAAITVSFSVRRYIGRRAWRMLHWGSFGLYALATAHGLLVGSSAAQPWMRCLYLASGATVVLLINYRILLTAVPGKCRTAGAAGEGGRLSGGRSSR